MPWHVPEDMAHFRAKTRGCPVIMGRKTWESLPERFRPLPKRINIVITRDADRSVTLTDEGAVAASSLEEALELALEEAQKQAAGTQQTSAAQIWIMGGGAVYAEAVQKGLADIAEVTRLDLSTEGDTYAPALDSTEWTLAAAEPESGWQDSASGIGYRFETYQRV